MAISSRTQDLNIKVEPRENGTLTESGLLKLANGTIMVRHATESGLREEEEAALEQQAANAEAQMREMLAAREAQVPELIAATSGQAVKKRTRKKAAAQVVPATTPAPVVVSTTVTVEGFGGIPSQYAFVQIGNDNAWLGLTAMSFVPQQATIKEDGTPSQVLRLSAAPDKRYVYLGSQNTTKDGVTTLILAELPGE